MICRVTLGDGSTDTGNYQEGDIDCCAPEIDSATSEPAPEKQRYPISDELKTRVDQVELEGLIVRYPGF